jgi:hypothetical protein
MSSLATTPPVSMGASASGGQPRRASASAATPGGRSLSKSVAFFASERGGGGSLLPSLHNASNSNSNASGRPPALVVTDAAPATTTVGFSAPSAPVRVPALTSLAGQVGAGSSSSRGLLASALGGGEAGARAPGSSSAALLSPKTSLFADPTGRSSRLAREVSRALRCADLGPGDLKKNGQKKNKG